MILRRSSGDYNREGCSDILWRNSQRRCRCRKVNGNTGGRHRHSCEAWTKLPDLSSYGARQQAHCPGVEREIEAEISRLAARQDEGWGRVVIWTVLELVWLVAIFAVLGVFSRLH